MGHSMDKKPAILCLFSGGIDSAGALHVLLTDSQYAHYELIVHHIHIINRENRARAETRAVEEILTYYKKVFGEKFLFTYSTFDSTGFATMKSQWFPYDLDVNTFTAANIVAAHGNVEVIARGITKTDTEDVSEGQLNRRERANAILKSVLQYEDIEIPPYVFPVGDLSKEEIWNMLPQPVRQATWWCRRPVYQNDQPTPCGRCLTCKDVAKFHAIV